MLPAPPPAPLHRGSRARRSAARSPHGASRSRPAPWPGTAGRGAAGVSGGPSGGRRVPVAVEEEEEERGKGGHGRGPPLRRTMPRGGGRARLLPGLGSAGGAGRGGRCSTAGPGQGRRPGAAAGGRALCVCVSVCLSDVSVSPCPCVGCWGCGPCRGAVPSGRRPQPGPGLRGCPPVGIPAVPSEPRGPARSPPRARGSPRFSVCRSPAKKGRFHTA